MRKAVLFLFLLLFLTTSVFAQQKAPQNSFSIFVSNPGGGYSDARGSFFNADYGLEYERMLTPRWSAAASVASEQYNYVAVVGSTDILRVRSRGLPVDIIARYHFFTSARRWRPYAGFGVRYVRNPGDFPAGHGSRLTPELDGGIAFRMNRRFAIFGEVKQGIRSETGPIYDPLTKTSFGVRFGF